MIIASCEVLMALLLICGAGCDVRWFRLPNWLTSATAVMATAIVVASAGTPIAIAWHLGFGLLIFLLGMVAFQLRLLGGGDVKWIGGLAIWIGPSREFFRFIILMAVAGGILALVIFLIRRVWPDYGRQGGQTHLPYGVAIAVAGLDYWLRNALVGRNLNIWVFG
jgi:prepilin peptidase CpaA